jgi:hypothetical protein
VPAFRDNERWGRLVAEHRAKAGSWLGASLLAGVFSVLLALYVKGHPHTASAKTMLGVVVLAVVAVWFAREWNGLRRIHLTVYEHGFTFFDGEALHEVLWEKVSGVEAQYVPGMTRKGAADEANLVMLAIVVAGVRVRVPKEIEELGAFRDELKRKVGAPWRTTVIADLTQRG